MSSSYFSPVVTARQPKRTAVESHQWMEDENDFFCDLFAEAPVTTQTPKKQRLSADNPTPWKTPVDGFAESSTPTADNRELGTEQKQDEALFVTPDKGQIVSPSTLRPHKAKPILKDLSETRSVHTDTHPPCRPKSYAELFETKESAPSMGTETNTTTRPRRAVKYPKRYGIDDE